MDDIVAIPTCKRPELLALCLLRLSGAKDCPEVHIYADTSANIEEIGYVRDKYLPTATILHAKPHLKAPSGCWNILNSIKDAARFADDVYLVEEDVMVYPNFFLWHRAQTTAVSCGRKDKFFYPLFPGAYTNPGSCIRRAALDLLIPHINDDYFTRLRDYLDEHFDKIDRWSSLDDGLVRRIVKKNFGACAFAEPAVCAHQGFRNYGKNFDIYVNNSGDVEERIGRFLEIEQLILTSSDPRYRRYATDFEPFLP